MHCPGSQDYRASRMACLAEDSQTSKNLAAWNQSAGKPEYPHLEQRSKGRSVIAGLGPRAMGVRVNTIRGSMAIVARIGHSILTTISWFSDGLAQVPRKTGSLFLSCPEGPGPRHFPVAPVPLVAWIGSPGNVDERGDTRDRSAGRLGPLLRQGSSSSNRGINDLCQAISGLGAAASFASRGMWCSCLGVFVSSAVNRCNAYSKPPRPEGLGCGVYQPLVRAPRTWADESMWSHGA